jgi:histone-lysine N-methyltransferase SETMAR
MRHNPYSPNLAPSDLHLFGPLKDAFRGPCFVDDDNDDDEIKHTVREHIRRFGKDFYATGIQPLTRRWKKCVDNGEDFVEK